MIVVEIDSVRHKERRYSEVEPRNIPKYGISGILINGDWLLDGYHRLKWMKSRGTKTGIYINLE